MAPVVLQQAVKKPLGLAILRRETRERRGKRGRKTRISKDAPPALPSSTVPSVLLVQGLQGLWGRALETRSLSRTGGYLREKELLEGILTGAAPNLSSCVRPGFSATQGFLGEGWLTLRSLTS
ncbi:hypothetical protein CDAR_51431 [Caerostris darwini]|uniref:Uncharacterized protein n=1 Tax=Caerostris darwini TaxID=1538125 RepID=A0AAV4U654_9ARAC|nr:hypothetical protein CDAR_51431 [Caerostris darwini]